MHQKKSYTVHKRNSGLIEIRFNSSPESHMVLQELEKNLFCVVTTYVDPTVRGQGIGKQLYLNMINFIRSEKAKFKATCPFVADMASRDKTIKDIYLTQ